MCAYLVYRIVLKRHIIVFTLFRYPVISSGQKCQQELHKLTLKLPGGGGIKDRMITSYWSLPVVENIPFNHHLYTKISTD